MAQQNGAGLTPADVYAPPQRKRGSRIPTLIWLILVAAAVAGGFYAGRELPILQEDEAEQVNFGDLGGKTSLSEEELDKAVGSYVLDGEVRMVTAREAIAQQSSLEAAKNSDGSYAMPSAESVLAAARTAVLMGEVERREITVSDDELVAYAQETFDTDDLASLAAAYTMDEETLRARLGESAALAKLRAEVVSDPGDAPQQPAEPEDGDRETASSEYAEYIIALAGDEWDAEAGNWASFDGTFATALHDYDIRSDSAPYSAASTAYDVAYQLYSARVTSANTQWTDFVNGLLCEAQLAVSTLGS